MRDFSVDALVIRETLAGENDKLLTLLTADRGRIQVMAKGVRSIKSRLRGPCQAFVWGNFELHAAGADSFWVRGAEVIEGFPEIHFDIEKMYLAQYISDLCHELSGTGTPADDILRLALNSFHAISRSIRPDRMVKAVFEWRAAAVSGYMPDLGGCFECGKKDGTDMYLDVMNGRIVCAGCREEETAENPAPYPDQGVSADPFGTRVILIPLTPAVLSALRYVLEAAPQRILSFELKKEPDREDFCHICETYLLNHLERGFASLRFYNEISRSGNKPQ